MDVTHQITQLWLRRLLLFVLAGALMIGVVFFSTGKVPLYATGSAAPANAKPQVVGYGWSGTQYAGRLELYLKELFRGQLVLTNQPGAASNWLHSGERLPMLPQIAASWWSSFKLFAVAFGVGGGLGVLIGIVVAFHSRLVRGVSLGLSVVTLSIPDFLWVVLGQMATIWSFRHFGVSLFHVLGGGDSLKDFALPLIALSLMPLGYAIRLTAGAMEEIMTEDYIRTARAKGIHEGRVIVGHALRNALPRVAAGLPGMLAVVLSSLYVVEYLTNYPGLTKWLEVYQTEAIATAGLCFVAWFVLFDGLANTLRLLVSPPREEGLEL